MLTARSLLSVATLSLVFASACGDESDDGAGTGTGGGAAGGSAAGSEAGGSAGRVGSGGSAASTAGTAAGGTGGASAGSAGASQGGSAGTAGGMTHCSPGTLLAESAIWDDHITQCNGYVAEENGMPPGQVVVRAVTLDQPLAAGASYGFSIEIKAAGPDVSVELWGASAACGSASEQLFSGHVDPSVLCVELEPEQAHDYVLVVFRGDGPGLFGDITLCPSGGCG